MSSPFSLFQMGQELFPFNSNPAADPNLNIGTNAEKLGGTWEVGTVFHVRDGFVVSGSATTEVNSFYFPNGTNSGKPQFYRSGYATPSCVWDGFNWLIFDNSDSVVHGATEDVDFPWEVTLWYDIDGVTPSDPQPTLTHPAVQTLVAPSSDQGGVAVIGGTLDGIYTDRGAGGHGNRFYNILSQPDSQSFYVIVWSGSQWSIKADSGIIYYSQSNVATPDLATNWKNGSDDTPASIIVTSVTEGEINAGLAITNDGSTNGSSYVSAPFHGRQYYMGLNGGGSNNMHWDTDFNVWTDDVGAWTTSNVPFPWEGSDNGGGHTGATFAINPVADEHNWENS